MNKLENSYAELPDRFFAPCRPEIFKNPKLICFNEQLAKELNMDLEHFSKKQLAEVFSGKKLLPGSEPLALAYAGFQFGHPVPELGDGRAHLLGESLGHDIQLKGSGQTPFSRRGDGRSALGPVLREYLVSEAMHALGIPSTRALCAVSTGEEVLRQYGPEPGGVFTRVAQSHLRVGTFQYFAFRKDLEAIEILLNYSLKRHYPELLSLSNLKDKSLALLHSLIDKQSNLVAKWSSVGFIHGVMNTDNFSMAGITLDYGPCAFMDEFKFHKVFSSIDRQGRYSFYNQVPIAQWNILRLADCLLPFIDQKQEKAAAIIESELKEKLEVFSQKRLEAFAKKLGIEEFQKTDQELINTFLKYLEENTLDFTQSFRNLPELYHGDQTHFPNSESLDLFLKQWKKRVKKVDHLKEINPIYIPRNHQLEKAIELAYQEDFSHFHFLLKGLQNPYTENDQYQQLAEAPSKDQRVYQTFCGT